MVTIDVDFKSKFPGDFGNLSPSDWVSAALNISYLQARFLHL